MLAAWTVGTTAFLWPRLDWARRLPPVFWLETAVLVGLLFVGFGTRQWHVVHSTIPLAFAAILVSPRAAAGMTLALVCALWGAQLAYSAGAGSLVEASSGPLTPSAIYVAAAALLLVVRLLFSDIRRIAAAQRRVAESVLAIRHAEFKRLELAGVTRELVLPLTGLLRGIASEARAAVGRAGEQTAVRGETLVAACEAAEAALAELSARAGAGGPERTPGEQPASVLGEVEAAVGRAHGLGSPPIRVEGGLAPDRPLGPDEAAALRRLLREALANAAKHGDAPLVVRIGTAAGPWIEIENRAEHGPEPRPGGLGLTSLADDARALGGALALSFSAGRVTVRVDLPPVAPDRRRRPAGAPATFAETVRRRRQAYERALYAARAGIALITVQVIVVERAEYGEKTALYAATAVAIALWSLLLAAWRPGGRPLLPRSRALLVLDGAAILAVDVALGGLSAPWLGVTLVTIMPAATFGGAAAGLLFAAAAAVALLAGSAIAGAFEPAALVAVCLTFAVVCALAGGIRWAFSRLSEATAAHDAATAELADLDRRSAAAEAREETRRELHSSLCHSIYAAAIAHDGIARRTPADPRLTRLGVTLRTASAALGELMDSLRPRTT